MYNAWCWQRCSNGDLELTFYTIACARDGKELQLDMQALRVSDIDTTCSTGDYCIPSHPYMPEINPVKCQYCSGTTQSAPCSLPEEAAHLKSATSSMADATIPITTRDAKRTSTSSPILWQPLRLYTESFCLASVPNVSSLPSHLIRHAGDQAHDNQSLKSRSNVPTFLLLRA